jgi:hypothetical protein
MMPSESCAAAISDAIQAREPRQKTEKGHTEVYFLCPCHAETAPSCCYRPDTGEWFCHGCGAKGGPAQLCRALGIQFEGRDPARKKQPPRPAWDCGDGLHWPYPVARRFVYVDESGIPLFEALRLTQPDGSKTFRQAHYAAGKWRAGMDDVTPILYHADDLAKARAQPVAPVWVAEGEKCADALRILGLVATTSPMGAGKWRPDYSEQLKGLDVIILPDHDLPGWGHAQHAANSLTDVASRVRVLEIAREFPGPWEKGADVADWIERERAAKATTETIVRQLFEAAGRCRTWERCASTPEIAMWKAKLVCDAEGTPVQTPANVTHWLRHPDISGCLAYDLRHSRSMILRRPPWPAATETYPRPATDQDLISIRDWLAHRGVKAGKQVIADSHDLVSHETEYDPVCLWLDALPDWDGQARAEALLIATLGAEDTPYVRAVTRAFLIGAVARARQPGCKADCMVVLEGPQGIGKSTALQSLVSEPDWYCGRLPAGGGKDTLELLQGPWIVEASELEGFGKTDLETLKALMSNPTDRYRAPYDRIAQDRPRRCVFAGTVNEHQYLSDSTGSRRFWPLRCHGAGLTICQIIERIGGMREQLWAEVQGWYNAGEAWYLDALVEKSAAAETENRRIMDPWERTLCDRLMTHTEVSMDDCLGWLELSVKDRNHSHTIRVGRILQRLGWEKAWDGKRRVYRREAGK